MNPTKYFIIKEAQLSNNCPECYSNDGLQLTFSQKIIDSILYKANGKEIVTKMHCKNCDTQIFPERWTEDIERVVAYQKRALQIKPKNIKLKPLAWVLIVLDVIILVSILLFVTGILSI